MKPLEKAIALAGGTQGALAEAIGKKQAHVWNWLNKYPIPPEEVLRISKAVEYQVTPHELRPDIYPNPTDGLPAKADA